MAKGGEGYSFKRSAINLGLLLIVLLGVAGVITWHHVYNDPHRAFWAMLDNSLSTSSITRSVLETNAPQQITRLSLGGQSVARAITKVQQPSATGIDTVVTETLGTTAADYARYISINTAQRGKNNQPLNFSTVLGVWGKSDPSTTGQPAQFLNGTIFNVIPFAPLQSPERAQVLKTMHDQNTYSVDYAKVTSRNERGRSAYVYKVTVQAKNYVAMLKTLSHELGLSQLDSVNPAAYDQSAPIKLEIAVDKVSHQLLTVKYLDSNRQETYSGHGLQSQTSIPATTVPITELQQRLETIQ